MRRAALRGCHQHIDSYIKPRLEDRPDRAYARMKALLKNAGRPGIRSHDLRHTFATMSLENGMDVKTLSAIIGHVSSTATLNIYTHITGEMQRNAARSIDRGIAGAEVQERDEPEREGSAPAVEFTTLQPFAPQAGDRLCEQDRRPPVGRTLLAQVDRRQEARPQHLRPYREECEEKLAALIVRMKGELAALKAEQAAGTASGHWGTASGH